MYGCCGKNQRNIYIKKLMIKNAHILCVGVHCSVKNTCLRYTKSRTTEVDDGTIFKIVRNCTNQRMYMQDENNINNDSKRR